MYLYSVRYSDHNRNKKLLKIPYLVHISTETTVVWPKVAQTKEFVLRCGIIVAEKFFLVSSIDAAIRKVLGGWSRIPTRTSRFGNDAPQLKYSFNATQLCICYFSETKIVILISSRYKRVLSRYKSLVNAFTKRITDFCIAKKQLKRNKTSKKFVSSVQNSFIYFFIYVCHLSLFYLANEKSNLILCLLQFHFGWGLGV